MTRKKEMQHNNKFLFICNKFIYHPGMMTLSLIRLIVGICILIYHVNIVEFIVNHISFVTNQIVLLLMLVYAISLICRSIAFIFDDGNNDIMYF